ncbi:MAG: tetratricopeptide repeat protein [Candidatus Gracilibacteria bacterium]|nr:tetratricopeptide repeat protein [Candidatus Gracilibacteria bacterium]
MPVLFYVGVLIGSSTLLSSVWVRRFRIVRQTLLMQNDLEKQQKKIERAQKKEKRAHEKALKELKRTSEVKQQALRNLGATSDLMKKALQELESTDDEMAQKTLIQVISLDENHRKGNELLAELYLRVSQPKRAELIYKKLINLYPFDPNYPSQLARCYFNRRQFKAAAQHFEKALEMDKGNPARYISLGELYIVKKDYSHALLYFEKAHRLSVRDIELMFTIVDTCLNNTDPITAREYLHKILDYEPYNQQAKTMLGDVLRTLKEEA